MTHSATMVSLAAAQTPAQLLLALKDLKNSVIGNTWKKVEVAEDEEVMQLYVPSFCVTLKVGVQPWSVVYGGAAAECAA